MASYRAVNQILREALFAAGFSPIDEGRVSAPAGMNHRKGRSLFTKVFAKVAEYSAEDAWKRYESGAADHLGCPNCGTMPKFIGFHPIDS